LLAYIPVLQEPAIKDAARVLWAAILMEVQMELVKLVLLARMRHLARPYVHLAS